MRAEVNIAQVHEDLKIIWLGWMKEFEDGE